MWAKWPWLTRIRRARRRSLRIRIRSSRGLRSLTFRRSRIGFLNCGGESHWDWRAGCATKLSPSPREKKRGAPHNQTSSRFERFEFVERTRPVLVHQSRKRAVGEQPASGLALCTIVRFVTCVADALDLGAASRARLSIEAVHGHLGTKRSHFFRKFIARFGAQAVRPFEQGRASAFVKPPEFIVGELLRHRNRRELCAMQDLVGVRVA